MPPAPEKPASREDSPTRRPQVRISTLMLVVAAAAILLSILRLPEGGPVFLAVAGTLLLAAGFIVLTVGFFLALMGLGGLGFMLMGACARLAGWFRRLGSWPEEDESDRGF